MTFALSSNGIIIGRLSACRAYLQDYSIGLPPNRRVCIGDVDQIEPIKSKLNVLEESIGFALTEFSNKNGYYELTPDERWMRCAPMISLYTLILRLFWRDFDIKDWELVGPTDIHSKYGDGYEFNEAAKCIPLFLKHLDELFPDDSSFTIFAGTSSVWHSNGVNFIIEGFSSVYDYTLKENQKPPFKAYTESINEMWRKIKNEKV